jgi:glycosyltransferase 2 family protein
MDDTWLIHGWNYVSRVSFLCTRMAETPTKKSKIGRWLKLILKIIVSAACIWYVSGKIDFGKAGEALSNANWLYLAGALVMFVLSKIFASIRLNIYFRDIHIHMHEWQNLKLYWLGMFYNLFLPGSISGDAYKVVVLTKKYGVPYRKTTLAVLLDRFSGLLGLALILSVYSVIVLKTNFYIILALLAIAFAFAAYYFIIRRYFRDFLPHFLSTLLWAIAVQGSQVICAYLIMGALGIPAHVTEYIFIFLISSVVAVLPLTVGGLGIRELVFLKGSQYFDLVEENSVVISILFYLVTLFTSLWGMWFMFRNPLNEKRTQE